MRSHRLTKSELDGLGRQVVVAGSSFDEEIDRIVSDPKLFDGVRARIAAAGSPVRPRTARGSVWKPIASASMVLALLTVPLLAYLKYTGAADPIVRRPRSVPVAPKEMPFVPQSRPVPEPKAEVQKTYSPVSTSVPTMRAELESTQRARRPRPVQPEPAAVFQPIGLDDRAEDAAIDGRVVRVELPRATLFAMGVDLPLENGTRPVRADLLIGTDGVPRAIRLVE